MQNRREFCIRDCIFVQIQLMTYFDNEINRGLCRRGDFKLRLLYSSIKVDPQSISLRTVRSIEELTQYILTNSLNNDVTLPNLTLNSIDSETASQNTNTTLMSKESIDSTQPMITSTPVDPNCLEAQVSSGPNEAQVSTIATKHKDIDIFFDNISKLDYAECKSQESRAKWLVDNKRIKHFIEDKIYHVNSESGNVYIVKLSNKPECTCPAKKNCVHILACKHSNGEDLTLKKPIRIALVSSKRNNRASGRKHLHNIKELPVQVLNKHSLIKGNK
jgi:hypothetical protein